MNVSLIQSVNGTRSIHKSNNNALCIFGQITKSNAILLHNSKAGYGILDEKIKIYIIARLQRDDS